MHAHLHREPAGGEGDDDDDDETRDSSLGSRRLGLLSVGPPSAADRSALAQQSPDHGAVENADGDQRNEECEREERSVEDARVTQVTGQDVLVGARRSLLIVLHKLNHLPTQRHRTGLYQG